MKIKELEIFLNATYIPEIKVVPKTFLGIARQPHYENVISNIYAFYLTDNEEHNLKDLFISSLIKLINNKIKPESNYRILGETTAETEVSTLKGGRIDILLQSDDLAIIVENKIYHYLANDLQDYWNSVKASKKIGVVLSLRELYKTGHSGFVNITHHEFLIDVFKNIGGYLLNANPKHLLFLNDFYQNVINLSNPMDKEYLDFYYQHQEKIAQLTKIMDDINSHIKREVESACEMIDRGLLLANKRGSDYKYYVSPKNQNLMFTIYFGNLIKHNKELLIIIELKSELLTRKNEILSLDFEENKKLINKDFLEDTKTNWAHFATTTYHPTNNDIIILKEFIVDKINSDGLLYIFEKIESYCKNGNTDTQYPLTDQ